MKHFPMKLHLQGELGQRITKLWEKGMSLKTHMKKAKAKKPHQKQQQKATPNHDPLKKSE